MKCGVCEERDATARVSAPESFGYACRQCLPEVIKRIQGESGPRVRVSPI